MPHDTAAQHDTPQHDAPQHPAPEHDTSPQHRPDRWPLGPPADTESDELVARLRARRSASGVAAAYAATHGHPADPRAERGAARWALTGTTAIVAVVAVLALGVVVALFSMGDGDVTELAQLGQADEQSAASNGGAGVDGSSVPSPSSAAPPESSGAAQDAAAGGEGLLVHVVGEVAEPGLVTVPDGARVADAVQEAGGATSKADLTALNLARTVADGEQLYVPRPGEAVPGPTSGAAGSSGDSSGGTAGGTIDVNTADAVALEELPGVGPSIAQAIIEWREATGPFASVDELEDVPGIGPATLEEIRATARVGP